MSYWLNDSDIDEAERIRLKTEVKRLRKLLESLDRVLNPSASFDIKGLSEELPPPVMYSISEEQYKGIKRAKFLLQQWRG